MFHWLKYQFVRHTSRQSLIDSVSFPVSSVRTSAKRIGTGLLFWDSILKSETAIEAVRSKVQKLMRFPVCETFLVNGSEIFSFIQKGTGVELQDDLPPDGVLERLDMLDESQPAVVFKRVNGENRTSTVAYKSSAVGAIVRGLSELGDLVCVQKYCKLSKLSSRAKVLRVCYSSGSKPFGFLIANIRSPRDYKVEDLEDTALTQRFCASLETSPIEDLSILKVSGKSIEEESEIAKKVFHFVEIFFRLRLTDIVVDIIGGRVVQIKSLNVSSTAPLVKLALPVTEASSWTCPVCNIPRPNELTKIVSSKMIKSCLKSFKERNIQNVFISRTHVSDTIRCCDICYSLILNEQELNRVSVKFSSKCLSREGVAVNINTPAPKNILATSHIRLIIGLGGFTHTPGDLSVAKARITVSLLEGKILMKFNQHTNRSFRVLDFISNDFLFPEVDLSLTVTLQSGKAYQGSISDVFGNHRSTPSIYACFLGHGKWNISVLVSFAVSHVPCPLANGFAMPGTNMTLLHNNVPCIPLPDSWIPIINQLN